MIHPTQYQPLDESNKRLQKAWERVLIARQRSDTQEIETAVLSYLQTLQQLNVRVETAITAK